MERGGSMTTPDHTVLVLGGAGSVGTAAARLLVQRGHFQHIILADRQGDRVQPRARELGAEAVVIEVTAPLLSLV
jgi:NADPH:quinone reductase-like Zn-dependent oxidoreductase